jgi:hypothetical protein
MDSATLFPDASTVSMLRLSVGVLSMSSMPSAIQEQLLAHVAELVALRGPTENLTKMAGCCAMIASLALTLQFQALCVMAKEQGEPEPPQPTKATN